MKAVSIRTRTVQSTRPNGDRAATPKPLKDGQKHYPGEMLCRSKSEG